MRLPQFLISTALISLALNTAEAAPTDPKEDLRPDLVINNLPAVDADVNVPLRPAPSALIAADKEIASAYYDTLSILSNNNGCSDFFGGPAASVEVFNEMMGQVKKDYVAPTIGMAMSGETANVINAQTHKEFRLFNKVTLNANGPFYRRSSGSGARVGSFAASTREARVLMFLHELGHLVKGPDGKWLLPNDGNDEALSRRNSTTVESVCGDEINRLGAGEAALNLAKRAPAEERFSLAHIPGAPEL